MPPTPDTAPSRKLRAAQVRVIRLAYASGDVTLEALASLFGVRRETIFKVVVRETWRDE